MPHAADGCMMQTYHLLHFPEDKIINVQKFQSEANMTFRFRPTRWLCSSFDNCGTITEKRPMVSSHSISRFSVVGIVKLPFNCVK